MDHIIRKNIIKINVIQKIIDTHLYDGKKLLTNDIHKAIQIKLKLKERRSVIPGVIDKLMGPIDRFSDF